MWCVSVHCALLLVAQHYAEMCGLQTRLLLLVVLWSFAVTKDECESHNNRVLEIVFDEFSDFMHVAILQRIDGKNLLLL